MDWINALKTDENTALRELYLLYHGPCISWLQNEFQCSVEDSLDIFQVSVVILYDNVVTGKLQQLTSSIKTYLMGIARNKALEMIRSRKNHNSVDDLQNWVQYVVSDDEEWKTRESQLNASTIALSSLGDPCKSLLTHFYYESKSMEEITAIMGYKNADTTKNQKYKCLKRLQNLYSEHITKSESI